MQVYGFLLIVSSLSWTIVAQLLAVNTPNQVNFCEPVQISWVEGGNSGPWVVQIFAASNDNQALETVGTTSQRSITWTPMEPAGTQVRILVGDNDSGATAVSPVFTIGSGTCASSTSSKTSSPTSTTKLQGSSCTPFTSTITVTRSPTSMMQCPTSKTSSCKASVSSITVTQARVTVTRTETQTTTIQHPGQPSCAFELLQNNDPHENFCCYRN